MITLLARAHFDPASSFIFSRTNSERSQVTCEMEEGSK
jgi:hypothetical protein